MFNLPQIEQKILKFWQDQDIFDKLREKNKNGPRWSFLDGPITANNPMGVHHGWGRTLKDLFQRYHAMKGEQLRYQNGFDCQGLWVEVEVEKELNFKTKKDIEEYGIDKFVNKCKERVKRYSAIQTRQSKRLGYWMDWGNSYYTMSDENNYMIWYFLKKVWENGDLYKGRDSVPWCPRCGTAISQHEILTEEYQELTHKSVFFKLPIEDRQDEYFLVWTTTPWTIPANVALAVNPEFIYLKAKNKQGEILYFVSMKDELASNDLKWRTVIEDKFKLEVIDKVKGSELVGLKYQGPFDDLPRVKQAREENPETFHSVVGDEQLVTAFEGTGIVHIAPGAGAEDFALGKEKKLPVIEVIDEAAVYLDGLNDFTGQNAKRNPKIIFEYLEKKDLPILPNRRLQRAGNGKFLVKLENYTHRYPTCWRCKEELVWRVVDEWYISMDRLRYKMMEVAKKINWRPEFGLDRELDWLKNMHDWLISKKRYWGLALPIWECECGHFEVIGSKQELKEKASKGWSEFEGNSPHRPWVDVIKIKCPKCGKLTSRIPDVGNPWLDAGIVSFSTFTDPDTKKLSYLDDKKYWQEWFPADFVTECFPGQFKNWFYSLIAMSTVLVNTNPFKVVLGHASVKDEEGEEMHKSKGNTIWFDEAVEKMGADVMRWMYLSNNPALDLRFGYHKGGDVKRKVFIPLLNILNFYQTFARDAKSANSFANIANEPATFNVLDRWIISKLNLLIKKVTESLNDFNPTKASEELEDFITELSVWYVRRSRNRFKGSASADKDEGKDKNQAIFTLGKVLFELSKLMAPFTPFIAEYIYQELTTRINADNNVDKRGYKESVHLEEWPKVNKKFIDQKVLDYMDVTRKIVELGLAKRAEAGIKVRQPLQQLTINNQQLTREYVDLIKDELNVKEVIFDKDSSGELSVELDIEITDELKREGYLRELVRTINERRKKMNLTIKDRIVIQYNTMDKPLAAVFEKYKDELLRQTLADKLVESSEELEKVKVNGVEVWLGIKNQKPNIKNKKHILKM